MGKRQYSDDEKAVALTYLEVNQGDVSKTARQVGISRQLLTFWKNGQGTHPVVQEILQDKKGDLAARYEEKIHLLVDSITPEKIAEAPLQQLTTAIGTLQDKMQTLRGEASSITQSKLSEDERSLRIADILLKAQQRINESRGD